MPASTVKHPAMKLAITLALGGVVAIGGCDARRRPAVGNDTVVVESGADDFVAAAEAAVRAGDKRRALQEFAKALEKNPTLTNAHLGMADIYRVDGDYNKAQQAYHKAAQSDPRNFDAQYYDGLMLHVLDRLQEAISAYLRSLALRPNDFNANLNVGAAYFQMAEYDQGLPFAQTAVRIDPKSGTARFSLGAIYAGLGRHADAVAEYEQALDTNADLPAKLLMNLSASYGALGRFNEMRNTLQRLVKENPSPAAWERLGFAHFRLENIGEAKNAYQEALNIDKDYYPALNGIGVCELNSYVWSEQRDDAARTRAMAALRRSLQINKNQPRVQDLLVRFAQ